MSAELRFVGMFRIRNEVEWIQEVLEAALPLCEHLYVMDDDSDDGTLEVCRSMPPELVTTYSSPFPAGDLDEARDKNWLYTRILDNYPPGPGGYTWPDWIACIDGDEVLAEGGAELIRAQAESTTALSISPRILYLWDRPNQVRMDRRYGDFYRPSIFKVINPEFRWQSTPWKGNLHCASIPQELQGRTERSAAVLWHYGYITAERRMQKWLWYNRIDPDNEAEDCYRHMIQGDVPEIPPTARLRWAGPMELQEVPERGTRHPPELS